MAPKNKSNPYDRPLQACRKKIDAADRAILSALSERFKAVKKVGLVKQKYGLPLYQKARWTEVVEERVKLAQKLRVNEKFTRDLLKLVHKEAIRLQSGPTEKSKPTRTKK